MQESSGRPDITRLLREWQGGNAEALDRLVPLVYGELHTLASRYLSRERRDHTLQTTALVHEAYLKLAGQREVDWQSRAHFFGIAAQLMRRIEETVVVMGLSSATINREWAVARAWLYRELTGEATSATPGKVD
ncbi:MAG: ECF-type sigma factor [Dehalococcoidia bacterium]